MSWRTELETYIRKRWEIPENATVEFYEELGMDGYSCCAEYPSATVDIYWKYIPEGKKRQIKKHFPFSGSVFDLLEEMESDDSN